MVSTLSTLIQYSNGILSQSNEATEKNKRNSKRKEEVKLSSVADDMILYLTDPKDYTKKLLDLINTFSNIGGFKINI
jgi:predicted transcriptional regulator